MAIPSLKVSCAVLLVMLSVFVLSVHEMPGNFFQTHAKFTRTACYASFV